ncbi:MAG: ergothioneine biosynthesis protein EgtB [Actinobacteria bacterium]|nr:ergothioneine biosynthesis protein EgtB [Actinomycetota bacterium]
MTGPSEAGPAGLRAHVAAELDAARRRSLDLLAPLSEADLVRQHSPLMSPLCWDLAHVANFEDLWLVRALGGDAVGADHDHLYDAFANPRAERPSLPLLDPVGARAYLHEVRGRALDLLEHAELESSHELLGAGFVYGMVLQHEHQHDETMLATLQLMDAPGYRPPHSSPSSPPRPSWHEASGARPSRQRTWVAPGEEVLVDGGPFLMGTDTHAWAYDNERPAHVVDLAPFRIDVLPTTNSQYLEFVEAGGYQQRQWWSDAGWAWRMGAGLDHPGCWRRHGAGAWSQNRFGWEEDLALDEAVQHVCWYEADAYARWRGRRLPSEAEWEKAASWDPHKGVKRSYPWGDHEPTPALANLGQRRFGPAPVGSCPDGASAYGCQHMVGDVWEWTSSDFGPYPGFRAFPYKEYSQVFWGSDHKVLRGGSWATHRSAVRCTFRNWDYPIRRQIFAGLRCARDA